MASKSAQNKPSIVFCHGIWTDASCFNKVIPALQADWYEVIAAQYDLDSLAGDVATVKRTLGQVSSPAILVGHSYGGSVITMAGTDKRVVALVYIAALAPMRVRLRRARSTSSQRPRSSPTLRSQTAVYGCDGREFGFLQETCPRRSRNSFGLLSTSPPLICSQGIRKALPGKSKPSGYIVATNDYALQPELQRFAARHMSATTTEVASYHLPMLSHPELVINVIRAAARAVEGSGIVNVREHR